MHNTMPDALLDDIRDEPFLSAHFLTSPVSQIVETGYCRINQDSADGRVDRDAVRILMGSPFYFLTSLFDRVNMVKRFSNIF